MKDLEICVLDISRKLYCRDADGKMSQAKQCQEEAKVIEYCKSPKEEEKNLTEKIELFLEPIF